MGLEKFQWSPVGQKYTDRFRDKEIQSVDNGTYQWGHHTQLGESGQWYIKDYGDGTYLVADGSGGQVLSGSFRYNDHEGREDVSSEGYFELLYCL